jgi:hypothetical protein
MNYQFGKRKNRALVQSMLMTKNRANSIATVKRRRALLKKMGM